MKRVAAGMFLFALSSLLMAGGNSQSGQIVYGKSCKMCHGANGEGNQAVGKALGVSIPPLGSARIQSLSDDQIKKVISEGSGKMKAVKTISGGEIADVVSYVRTLAGK